MNIYAVYKHSKEFSFLIHMKLGESMGSQQTRLLHLLYVSY